MAGQHCKHEVRNVTPYNTALRAKLTELNKFDGAHEEYDSVERGLSCIVYQARFRWQGRYGE